MARLKILGLIFVLFSCTALGFYKSYKLSCRCKKLKEICLSLEKLAQLINSSTGELNRLLALSFRTDLLLIANDKPCFDTSFLQKNDTDILNTLFGEMGISQRENEYKRVVLYKTMLEKQSVSAEADVNKLSRLYNSVGFLSGLVICIFLI